MNYMNNINISLNINGKSPMIYIEIMKYSDRDGFKMKCKRKEKKINFFQIAELQTEKKTEKKH